MKNPIKISNKWIGENRPVFVIAEAGVNHNGNLSLAKKMIDVAIEIGADAVKFQSFKTEQIITPDAPSAEYHIRATGGKETWFDLLKRLELSENEQCELFAYCHSKGVIFLSTPYDEASADFLDKLGMKAFKIASTDMNNLPFLQCVAKYDKPIILSTGMSTLKEVSESVKAITSAGNRQIILLHCTSDYPPAPEDANLNVIETLKKKFKTIVGYSDHFASPQIAVAAVAKGVRVYEAHFTLDRKMPGPDQKSSLEPNEFKRIIADIRFIEKTLGSYDKVVTASEKETRLKLRKSLAAIADIKPGDRFTHANIGVKRPGIGLPPSMFKKILGKVAKRDIKKDVLIQKKDF